MKSWILALTSSVAAACGDSATSSDSTSAASTSASSGAETAAPTSAGDTQDTGTAAGLPDGEACSAEGECLNHCFVNPMTGGTCGECGADADCSSGGCTPPGFATPTPPTCNDGSLGMSCETSAACQAPLACGVVFDGGFLLIRGCSECTTDDDCGADLCNPTVSLGTQGGYLACVGSASVAVGGTCLLDAACTSGICAGIDIMGLGTISVCSECRVDADCPDNGACTPAAVDMATFSLIPGKCA